MAVPAQDKYYLRSLHQEIDLFDRKLAHLLRFDSFINDAERKASASKLVAKRETLARTARKLMEDGIEFKSSELPRSFRSEPVDAPTDTEAKLPVEALEAAEMTAPAPKKVHKIPSPYAGTIFDVQADVQAYKRSRSKVQRPVA